MSHPRQALSKLLRHEQKKWCFQPLSWGALCCSNRTLTQWSSSLLGFGEISIPNVRLVKIFHTLTYESLREVSA